MHFPQLKKVIVSIGIIFLSHYVTNSQTISYKNATSPLYKGFDTLRPTITGDFNGIGGPLSVQYIAGKPFEGGYRDGVGGTARFVDKFKFAPDGLGNFYVYSGNRIRKIDAKGVVTTFAGNGNKKIANGFRTSASIRYENDGSLAVNPVTGEIYFYDQEYISKQIELKYDRSTYILHGYTVHYIRKINPQTGIVSTVSRSEGGFMPHRSDYARFGWITDMVFDKNGKLYMTDGTNNCIWMVANDWFYALSGGGSPKNKPYGIEKGDKGYVDGPLSNALFNFPNAIAINPKTNEIIVGDYGNSRVRVINTTNNTVSTVLGRGQQSLYPTDGNVNNATFYSINSLAVDSVGKIYVVDHQAIREYDPATNVVKTIAGEADAYTYGGYGAEAPLAKDARFSNLGNIHINPINGRLVFHTSYAFAELINTKFSINPSLPSELKFDYQTGIVTSNYRYLYSKYNQLHTVKGYNNNDSSAISQFQITITDSIIGISADTTLDLRPSSAKLVGTLNKLIEKINIYRGYFTYKKVGDQLSVRYISLDSVKNGQNVVDLYDLMPNTEYEFRITTHSDMVYQVSSNFKKFRTPSASPIVLTTAPATNIRATTATLGGNITDDKLDSIRTRGILYSTSKSNLTMQLGTIVRSGSDTGSYVTNLTNLRGGFTYYAVAFAANRFDTTLATDTVTFTTLLLGPQLDATTTISALRPRSAMLGGNILSDRGDTVLERGVLLSLVKSNLVYGQANKYTAGLGTGVFEVKTFVPFALLPGTTYHALAFARNASDVGYASDTLTFTTPQNLASVSTNAPSTVGSTWAKVGGDVSSDNGDSVTIKGVIFRLGYSAFDSSFLLNNPQSLTTRLHMGSGVGSFDSSLTKLSGNSKYYYRAFATNESGTAYGPILSFTTLPAPTLATVGDGSIGTPSQHAIQLSGVITNDGLDTVLEKGFVIDTLGISPVYTTIEWNTEILNSIFQIKCGSGNDNFDTVFSQLASNSSYSVRAYAVNSVGVSYGKLYTFKTTSEAAGPFGNAAIQIPGRIEAENFDKGDDGVSFKEISYLSDKKVIENRGIGSSRRWDQANMKNVEEFRPTAVDIEATGDSVTRADGKNFQLAFTAKDEWVKYTVNANASSIKDYQFIIRYARGASADSLPGRVSIEVDGVKYADSIPIYGTGTWGTYSTAVVDTIPLSPGVHVVKLNFIDAGVGSGGSVGNINYIDVRESPIQRTGQLLKLNLNFGVKANVKNKPQTAVVKGRRLRPFALFRIFMHSTPLELASGNCDSLGDFSQPITLPQNTTPGKHSIDVFTFDSTGANIGESAYITVDANGFITEIINAGLGNDAPSEITLTYASNTDTDTTNTLIAKLSAVDYSRDIHTYTLTAGDGDMDNGLFVIKSDSLILSTIADYETRSEYRIRIRTTDNANNIIDTAIVITLVQGDDDVPGIKKPLIGPAATVTVTENTTNVTTVIAFDPKNMTLPYRYSIIGGDDANGFDISPSTGKLTFSQAPDYENPKDSGANNTYEVIVQALNIFDQNMKYDQTINVQVIDTTEAPAIKDPFSKNIQLNAATIGATIVGDGSLITERGIIWGFDDEASTLTLNTENVSKVISGTGAGELSIDLSDLSENSNYIFRVYAINALGTSYSDQVSFTTLSSKEKPLVTYNSPVKFKQNSESLLEPNVELGTVPAQEYKKVMTVAGTGNSGSQDGPAMQSTFNRPYGIAVNSAGQVFVADALNHSIRYFSVDDTVRVLAGSVSGVNNEGDSSILSQDALFNQPTGLAIDNMNNIYVSDQGNNQIRKISTNGSVSRIAGADKIGNGSNSGYVDSTGANAKFNQPEGLITDRDGVMLYVADKGNHVIRVINTLTHRVETYAGSGTAGSTDSNDPLTADFNQPTGLYIDEFDNMFVTEAGSHKVRKIDMNSGQVTTLAGSGSAGSSDGLGTSAQFNAPASIHGDGIGNLYVADLNNNTIRKIDSAGNVTTFAGTGASGAADGSATASTFNAPYGLVIDNNASVIYVSHSSANGNKIRSIGLGGYVLVDSLPAGLKFNNRTGVISGAATEVKADTTYKVHYANIYGNDSTIINIEVVANNKKISYLTPQTYVVSNTITPLTPQITGGSFDGGVNGRFTISPELPLGLSLDTATGIISGTPTERVQLTDYFVSGWDSTESVVTKLSIKVDPQIQLTISGTQVVSTKQYDGSRSASVTPGTLSGVANGHDVKVSALANYATASVENNKQIVTVYSISGGDSSKYLAPANDTLATGEITARQLTISGITITKSKVYDGTVSATVTAVTFTNTIETEDVQVNAVASYDTSSVGNNKTITTVFSISGGDAGNYIKPIDSVITDGVISRKQLTITAPTITLKKTIDGNTTATVQKGSLVGVVDGDDVSVSAKADYNTPDLGENKTITVVYTLSGGDKDNYIKPTDSVTNKGVIVDVVPSQLVYTPSSQVSGLNKPIVDMVPSSQGGKVVSYAITPALQPGLSFDTATGKISGTRTSLSGSGSGSVEYTITATNSGGSTTGKVTIIYNVPATNITLSKSNLYEGNQVGEVIGSLTSTDPDAGDTHSYSLVSGIGDTDNRFFSINGDKLLAGRVFDYKQRNSYSIRLRTTDQEGMSYEKSFTITISEKPVVVGRSSDLYYGVTNGTPVISRGSQSQLRVSGNGIASVQWTPATGLSNPNILNPIARPKQTTTYTITITNNAGSVTTLQVTVEVKNDYLVEPQNIVTPNGDGINDFWVIKNLEEYPDNEVTIYNRDGKIVYKSANYNQRWDGTSGGRKLATGTYYYILRFRDNPNALHKGFITLLHE